MYSFETEFCSSAKHKLNQTDSGSSPKYLISLLWSKSSTNKNVSLMLKDVNHRSIRHTERVAMISDNTPKKDFKWNTEIRIRKKAENDANKVLFPNYTFRFLSHLCLILTTGVWSNRLVTRNQTLDVEQKRDVGKSCFSEATSSPSKIAKTNERKET